MADCIAQQCLKYSLRIVVLTTAFFGGCDKSKDSSGGAPAPTDTLWDAACSKSEESYTCNHAKAAKYFADDGSNPFESMMDVYTFTLPVSGNTWTVTDANNASVSSITLTQGKPVKFIFKGDSTTAHYLNEPMLFFNSALFKVESKDTFSYTGPYVNAIENRVTSSDSGAAAYELAIYFIPMVRGMYDAYCQAGGVTNGSDYRMIRSGTVKPDLNSGHPATGMKITVTVEGDRDVTMAAPHGNIAEANQRAALDNHPWSDNASYALTKGPNQTTVSVSGKHLWDSQLINYISNGTTNSQCTGGSATVTVQNNAGSTTQTGVSLTGYCMFLVGNGEVFTQYADFANSGSAVAVTTATPLKLRTGHAHVLRISNSGSSDMTLELENLTRSFTIRKIQSKNSENKVDFIKTLTIKAGQWVDIFAVPMKAGDYSITTSNGTAVPVKVADTL